MFLVIYSKGGLIMLVYEFTLLFMMFTTILMIVYHVFLCLFTMFVDEF
jgi:hypothetical protein